MLKNRSYHLLDYLYESGTISKELYIEFKKNIEIENFVPLKRKTDKKEFRGETQNVTSPGSSGSLQKRKGSELVIKPVLNSIY